MRALFFFFFIIIIINFPFPQQSKGKLIIRLVFCLSGPGIRQRTAKCCVIPSLLAATNVHSPMKGTRNFGIGEIVERGIKIQLQDPESY